MISKFVVFLGGLAESDFAQNLARDFKSLRSLWNWVYMMLYVWMCVWAILFHPHAVPATITATAGVVSIIFTGYVLSKSYEKVARMRIDSEAESEEEHGAAD